MISARTVRYIKFGRGGEWAETSLERGELHFGHSKISHEMALAGDREAIKQVRIDQGRDTRAAAEDAREIVDFYRLGSDCLWITFAKDHLWWTFADPKVVWLGPGKGHGERLRNSIGGWRNTDINGKPLKTNTLNTKLTKVANYRRTICAVDAQEYLRRRINGLEEPLIAKSTQARDALLAAIGEAIASLHWADFETLVDVIFARSGWHRASALGGSQKLVDIVLEQPTTNERAVVQVKSSAVGEISACTGLWSSTQLAHEVRAFLMRLLQLDENQIRVVAPDVGGGFGAKFVMYPELVVISAACLRLRCPIKWIEDRREHFLAAVQERDQYWDLEVAFDDEGRLLGLRGELTHDQGAYTPQGLNLPYNASAGVPGPYILPAFDLRVLVVETNKVATMPVRGAGYPEAAFAMERVLDRIARQLGIDRTEVRRRNLVPADKMPYVTPLKTRAGSPIALDSGDFPRCLDMALDAIDYAGFAARSVARANKAAISASASAME